MKKDNKCKRMSALIIIVIMGILMFVYFTFCYIFQTHYFFHTTIDYIESSVQTVDTVSDILKDEFQKYSLHVIGREDTEVTISACIAENYGQSECMALACVNLERVFL